MTPEEVNAEIKNVAERNKMEPAEARKVMVENGSLMNLKAMMREEKTITYLLEKAKISGAGAPAQADEDKGKEEK